MEDPNRNEGVINIVESVNVPFSITTTLRIDAILGGNNTPILTNPPVDNAAIGVKFIHNPAAYTPMATVLHTVLRLVQEKVASLSAVTRFP